jgi:glycosyltransferase involved in cell wall biosynthesis
VPDVSVVIPTYNRKEFLADAIASCFDGNDGIDVEVVVVDDHSTDGTRAFLDQLDDERVRRLTNPGSGAQTARNAGLKAARAATVRFLDDDDYFYPGAVERQYRELLEQNADVVYGDLDRVTGEGNVIETLKLGPTDDMLEGLCRSAVYGHPAPFLFRTDVAKRCQWRPEFSHFGDDTAYIFDVAALNPEPTYIPGSVACWREHEGDRLSDLKGQEVPEEILRRRFRIVDQAYRKRVERGDTHSTLNAAVAQNLWHYTRLIAPFDFQQFVRNYNILLDQFPTFRPERPYRLLEWLDHQASPIITEAMLYFPRKLRAIIRS